jgi:RimJ/RimL family protein N-acetyltransferase
MIVGKRVRLRAAEQEDLPRFVAWLNDPEVREGLSLVLPFSLREEQDWFEEMVKGPPAQHVLVIEIREGEAWVPVGTCGFHVIDWRNSFAELGLAIGDKAYWDQGYGTEVVRLLLRHGFHTLNLHRIFLRVYANNTRAIRSYEKAGFVHEGRLRQSEFKHGEYVDVLIMSVLRPEWETNDTGG